MKANVLRVQPPAEVLEHMVSMRLHLDNCGEENGALRVIPGSHLHGRVPKKAVQAIRHTPEVVRGRHRRSVADASSAVPSLVARRASRITGVMHLM